MNAKLLGIDYGEKRVGIASTDETGHFALPRAVWTNDDTLLDRIVGFVHEEGIAKIIMGESRDFQGKPNPIHEKIEGFKREIEKRGIEVILHPEVLTTLEAGQIQGQTKMIDASAAALILKSFIDTVYNKGA